MSWISPSPLETITLAVVTAGLYFGNLIWPFTGVVIGAIMAAVSLAGLGWGLRRLHTDLGGDERSPICWYCGRSFPNMVDFVSHTETCYKEQKRRLGMMHEHNDTEEDER